jgi:hypothetical protein
MREVNERDRRALLPLESDGASHGEPLLESYQAYHTSGKGQGEMYADLPPAPKMMDR